MKTQAKNTLAFINIALLLLFFFGISSCSALQIRQGYKNPAIPRKWKCFLHLFYLCKERNRLELYKG